METLIHLGRCRRFTLKETPEQRGFFFFRGEVKATTNVTQMGTVVGFLKRESHRFNVINR